MLHQNGMKISKSISSPVSPDLPYIDSIDTDKLSVETYHAYRGMVGSLMYSVKWTHSDL